MGSWVIILSGSCAAHASLLERARLVRNRQRKGQIKVRGNENYSSRLNHPSDGVGYAANYYGSKPDWAA